MAVSRKDLYLFNPGAVRRGIGLMLLFLGSLHVFVAVLVGLGVLETTITFQERMASCAACLIAGSACLAWGRSRRRWFRLAREYDGLVGDGSDIAEISSRKGTSAAEVVDDLGRLKKKGLLPDCAVDYDTGEVRRHPSPWSTPFQGSGEAARARAASRWMASGATVSSSSQARGADTGAPCLARRE